MNRRFKSVTISLISIVCISLFLPGCEKHVKWKAAIDQPCTDRGETEGISIYVDEQTLQGMIDDVNVIIVNESKKDIAVLEVDEMTIQKSINGQWCIVDLGSQIKPSILRYTRLPRGSAINLPLDISFLGKEWGAGSYRISLVICFFDDSMDLSSRYNLYHNFTIDRP